MGPEIRFVYFAFFAVLNPCPSVPSVVKRSASWRLPSSRGFDATSGGSNRLLSQLFRCVSWFAAGGKSDLRIFGLGLWTLDFRLPEK